MNYLKCVVKENFRLHPPAPLLAPRETTASVKIGGYEIPAKTRVFVNAWAIQRHPSSWDEPEEFVPERFENNPVDLNGQDFQFIPFGFGRRRCPGLALGLVTIEYLIANLLYWFDWKLPDDGGLPEDLDMTEVCGLSVHKKFPLHVIPILSCSVVPLNL
ncbi:Cytochrome P450 71A1 [Morus notabilis]|uniref:Cytochrome P450 71A1 n=2 Tax=Morus notabilis TaxID=981085 RepID=W9QY78_9ROSA|nr:Cytochrome P450 71A1 [Morus notabilis]